MDLSPPGARVMCYELRHHLDDLLDGEVGAAEAARLGRHLAACPECGAVMEHERIVLQGIRRALQSGEVPHWLDARSAAALAIAAHAGLAERSPGDR
jgi:anti-sigma factor (TIGR02949 family)